MAKDNNDSSADQSTHQAAASMDSLYSQLAYAFSIPERLLRSSAAIAGGLIKEMGDRLIPHALQETQLFQAFVSRTNQFVLEQVSGVEGVYEQSDEAQGYASRKALGNALEFGSLVTLHLSPLLVLAAASDVVKGGRGILQGIVSELKSDGVIDSHDQVDNFNDLLDSVHQFTVRLAEQADLPPLSLEELHSVGEAVQEDLQDMQKRQLLNQADIEQLAQGLHEIARKQDQEIWDVASAVALGSANALMRSAQGVLSAGKSGLRMFDDHIMDFYQEQYDDLMKEGIGQYFSRVSQPYYKAICKTWDEKKYTWTEAFLHGLSEYM